MQVLVPKDENMMGKLVEVDIVSCGKHYMMGKLVNEKEPHRPENVPPPFRKGQVSGIPAQVCPIYDNIPLLFCQVALHT